jgi:hypothetical protein
MFAVSSRVPIRPCGCLLAKVFSVRSSSSSGNWRRYGGDPSTGWRSFIRLAPTRLERGWGAAEEFTTLAFRHTAEDAVGEPPASQREVETSHPDRDRAQTAFARVVCCARPTPDIGKNSSGSSRRHAALSRQSIASIICLHPFDRWVAALGWVAHRRPGSRSGRPGCPGSARRRPVGDGAPRRPLRSRAGRERRRVP